MTGRTGRLPLVIWAYPLEYGDADTAGQVRGTSQRFTRLNAPDPVSSSCAATPCCSNATMPVVGDPETMNDTYVEQIPPPRPAIQALDKKGVIDPERVAWAATATARS